MSTNFSLATNYYGFMISKVTTDERNNVLVDKINGRWQTNYIQARWHIKATILLVLS